MEQFWICLWGICCLLGQYIKGKMQLKMKNNNVLKLINIPFFLLEIYVIVQFIMYVFVYENTCFISLEVMKLFMFGIFPTEVLIHILFLFEVIFYQSRFKGLYLLLLRLFSCFGTAAFFGIWIKYIF